MVITVTLRELRAWGHGVACTDRVLAGILLVFKDLEAVREVDARVSISQLSSSTAQNRACEKERCKAHF